MWGYGAGGAELVDASLGWRLEGHECGILLSAIAHGSIVVVEIRFFVGEKTYSGMFELPLHVFKKDGDFLTSSTAIKDFVGRGVWMTVNNRYQFNGISLSNAREIDLCDDVLYAERKSASVDVVPK
jgi:hypothetical protein